MKSKISPNGSLLIERAGKYLNQCCPHVDKEVFCGDWCPLFRENAPDDNRLWLCNGALLQITEDMREKKEK